MTSTPPQMSRRQRIIGLAKTTRDNYIPKITGSVSSLAAGASKAFTNPSEIYDEQGRIVLPKDTKIQLYPTYTRLFENKYYVDIAGWVSAPGLLTNRRNRMILTVIKKSMRQRDSFSANQELEQLRTDSSLGQDTFNNDSPTSSDAGSIASLESEKSMMSRDGVPSSEDVMKDRLAAFFAKSIPNTEIKITIGSENPNQEVADALVKTDDRGYFAISIQVDYKPSVVQAVSTMAETVFAFQEVLVYPSGGIGIISDIDDTVKKTGIVGDKRLLLRNLLVEHYETWTIPLVVNFYNELCKKEDVSFFYVSNSPWQLFTSIQLYFKLSGLPLGSVHLKKWVGNIMSSLIEPSHSRKKLALDKILEDFPEKKFLCFGDSGEQDLEAYVNLAQLFPNQVLSINIRFVENSFSDYDDWYIFDKLQRLLAKKQTNSTKRKLNEKNLTIPTRENPEKPVNASDSASTSTSNSVFGASSSSPVQEAPNLIDLDTVVTSPKKTMPPLPKKPKKPENLKGTPLDHKTNSIQKGSDENMFDDNLLAENSFQPNSANTSIDRRPLFSNVSSDGQWMVGAGLPPLPPRRQRAPKNTPQNIELKDELDLICNSPGYIEIEETDRKGANWIRRTVVALYMLKNTNTTIHFFTDDDKEFFKMLHTQVDEALDLALD